MLQYIQSAKKNVGCRSNKFRRNVRPQYKMEDGKLSVLKNKRIESPAQFVNTANDIYDETLAYVLRLSNRYSRLLASDIIKLATEVADECEKANTIFPEGDKNKELRQVHLIEARASLSALDIHLTRVYGILMKNPEGCFTTASGRTIETSEAKKRLDNMSQSLGEKIDSLNRMLNAVIKKDKER